MLSTNWSGLVGRHRRHNRPLAPAASESPGEGSNASNSRAVRRRIATRVHNLTEVPRRCPTDLRSPQSLAAGSRNFGAGPRIDARSGNAQVGTDQVPIGPSVARRIHARHLSASAVQPSIVRDGIARRINGAAKRRIAAKSIAATKGVLSLRRIASHRRAQAQQIATRVKNPSGPFASRR